MDQCLIQPSTEMLPQEADGIRRSTTRNVQSLKWMSLSNPSPHISWNLAEEETKSVLEPEVLEDIPEHTALGFPDIIEGQRQKGRKVAVYPVDEDAWMDMGQMTELEQMRKQLYGE